MQAAGNVFVAHAFHTGRAVIAASGVDVGSVGIGFIQVSVDAEPQYVLNNRAAEVEADAACSAFFAVLRLICIQVDLTFEFFRYFFGNDIDHAAHRAGTVAGGGRASQDGNGFDFFNRHPVAVAARVAFAAHTDAFRLARMDGFAVNQNQGVFRSHAAQVDLAFVATLAGGGVAGEVYTGHGADEFGNIVYGRPFFDVFGRNAGNAERLLELFFGGNVNGVERCAFYDGVSVGMGEGGGQCQRQHGQREEGEFALGRHIFPFLCAEWDKGNEI